MIQEFHLSIFLKKMKTLIQKDICIAVVYFIGSKTS